MAVPIETVSPLWGTPPPVQPVQFPGVAQSVSDVPFHVQAANGAAGLNDVAATLFAGAFLFPKILLRVVGQENLPPAAPLRPTTNAEAVIEIRMKAITNRVDRRGTRVLRAWRCLRAKGGIGTGRNIRRVELLDHKRHGGRSEKL